MDAALALDGLSPDVAAAARGDRAAYGRLVDAHGRLVASISLAIVKDLAASEDVAQDVFVAVWQSLPKLRSPQSFLPWLRQLTRNRAHKFLEARLRNKVSAARDEATEAVIAGAVDEQPGAEASLISLEERRAVAEALEALPDEAREILTLFYREGQSVKQVSALLGLQEDAAKKRLSRARVLLREDVLARFGEVAAKTSPGNAFTAVVIAALPTGSAGLIGAGAALAAKAGSVLLKVAFFFGGALLGLSCAICGILAGGKKLLAQSRDQRERRAVYLLVSAEIFWCVFFLVAYSFLQPLPNRWPALIAGLVFGAGLNTTIFLLRTRAIGRRLAAERSEDPTAALRQRRDIYWCVFGASAGAACGLSAVLYNFLR